MYDAPMFTPQGWVCPICHRVYSPTTSMCYYCGNRETTMETNTTYVGDTPETMKQRQTDGSVK